MLTMKGCETVPKLKSFIVSLQRRNKPSFPFIEHDCSYKKGLEQRSPQEYSKAQELEVTIGMTRETSTTIKAKTIF